MTTGRNDEAARNDDENYYRAKMGGLKNNLAADQKTLKYWGEQPYRDSAGRISFYSINEYKLAQAAVAADEKAIAELEEDCRRTGCFSGWLWR